MKKPNRRGGPASKMVMAGLVLATTVGFVSGLTRNVSSADGDSSVWSYVQSFFDGPYGNRKIATQSDQSRAQRTQTVTRFYSPISTDKFASHPVLEPRQITLVEPIVANTTGVDANGMATFDPTLVSVTTATSTSGALAPTVNSTVAWDGGAGGGTAWLTAANWAGDVLPDGTDVAQFGATGTATTIGINMAGATNNGANNEAVGAIELLSTRSRTIGDSSATSGTLTLNGVTVNGTSNVILRNAATALNLTLQNNGGGAGTMDVALGNANNNVVVIDSTGNITISSVVKNATGVATANLTLTGAGTGIFTLSGTAANTYNGTTTVNATELDLNKTAGVNAIAGNVVIGDGVGTDTVKLLAADQIANTSDVTINSSGVLNLNGNNETIDALNGVAGSSVTLGVGTLTVGANNDAGANFHGVISGTGGFIKTGTGTQILSGTNLYSGDTQVLSGDLRFDSGGTSNSSTIRLGDTSGTNTATLSLGVGSGNNVASALEVRAGSSGTKVLRSVATSGTNTYSGTITLNTGLTLEAISNGNVSASTLLLQGGSVDVKTNTLTVDTQVDFNGANSVNAQGNVTINEVLGSSSTTGGALVKDGSNTLILQGTTNTYTGTDATALNANGTTIKDGVLAIFDDLSLGKAPSSASNNVFFATSSLTSATNTPTLRADANGIVLASTRSINIASGVTARFDSNGNTFNIAGDINGAGNLNKIGSGTLALIGATSYTGTTTIDAGTLSAATTNALGSTGSGTSGITVNSGGTLLLAGNTNDRINDNATMKLNGQGSATVSFDTGGLSEHGAANNNAGIGALTLQSSSIIDMGTGASIIAFANSLAQSGNWNGTLSIYNWSGNPGPTGGNGTDQLYFGNDATGLSLAQLAQFQFYSGNGTGAYTPGALILADGEVVAPIPEPGTWIGAALALAAIGWTQRKGFAKRLRVIG